MSSEAARVSFYVVPGSESRDRLVFACRLAEKAWQLGHKVSVATASQEDAAALDDLMWTFRQGSFLPHALVPVPPATPAPIAITWPGAARDPADLLINLADDVPQDWRSFGRVAEVIDASPGIREAGRERFRWYREQGLDPETHKL
ncbi:MAG: DNA polymerase III subunit chi [Chromatiales bacterium]|nr:DNA polymerase III subunit chi [Chromatiales bacterium]